MKTLARPKYEIIQPIHYRADVEYLLDKANKLKKRDYTHKDGTKVPNYKFAHYHDDEIQGFLETMPFLTQCRYRTSFVWLTKNTELPWHTDKNNKCAIIWTLASAKDSCTYFRKWKGTYKDALFDTQKEHKVKVGSKDKIMYKISIVDKDFQWLVNQWQTCYKGFKLNRD